MIKIELLRSRSFVLEDAIIHAVINVPDESASPEMLIHAKYKRAAACGLITGNGILG